MGRTTQTTQPMNVSKFFSFPPLVTERKKEFFEQLVKDGQEGVILKNLRSGYVASSSRKRDGWVKVKKRIEFDAYLSGCERGKPDGKWHNLIGNLVFSVHTEKGDHVLGCPSNLTYEDRVKMSIYDPTTNTVTLNPAYLNKVAEISGQDISGRVLRLSHCTLDRWRDQPGDEKSADECVVSMADLEKAASWVD